MSLMVLRVHWWPRRPTGACHARSEGVALPERPVSARCVRLARSRASIAELCRWRNNAALRLLQSICSTGARRPLLVIGQDDMPSSRQRNLNLKQSDIISALE